MKKRYLLSFIVITIYIINFCLIYFYDFNMEIVNIHFDGYDETKELLTITVEKNKSILFDHDFYCYTEGNNFEIKTHGKNNKCTLTLSSDSDYKFSLINDIKQSKTKEILDYIDNQLTFKFSREKIYLAIGEETSINYIEKYIVPVQQFYNFTSSNTDIASISGNKIIGNSVGKTIITEPRSGSVMEVEVTDLISAPEFSKTKKKIIPCNYYSLEDSQKLDELLSYYVDSAGLGTRAGAVAAARFLTLQFEFRIPYFYENGRLNETGVNYADGEGRYYNNGLYLHESKYKDIKYKFNGPAIWGCPLRNWDNNEKYGFKAGNRMPNGLDCSGFVSWALKNGGFDPGDYGAGNTPGSKPQMTKTGEYKRITSSMITNNEIKTGDLFNYPGHIAIIIGQDETYYYVAESLPHLGGVVATKYRKTKVRYTFPYVVLMDSFYKEDGNLTDNF